MVVRVNEKNPRPPFRERRWGTRLSVEAAVEDGGDLTDFGEEFGEFAGKDGLDAVREGFVGFVVDFDEQAIGADSDSSAGKRQNFVALAGAVRGIDEDGQVAALFDGGNDGEIERVTGEVGEGADAAFAEHHVVVALGEDVFSGHEKFVERGGHAALEKDGKLGAAGAFEEREILHVARADLDDVGVLLDEVEGFVVNGFGDDSEAELLADVREDFQAGEAESLERVRRSARLVGAAAEKADAGGLELPGDGEALLFGFDGAGSGDHGDVRAADEDITGRRGDFDDGVFFLHVAGDEFVGLGDRDALDDAGHGFKCAEVDGAGIAGDADGGAARAGDRMGFQAKGFDAITNGADLLFGGVGLHDYEHGLRPRIVGTKK